MSTMSAKAPAEPLYLVDASIYIFQAHFSPWRQQQDDNGEDQAAFIGFAGFLLRLLRVTRARQLAVAFDESLFCGFRHQLHPHYKANRELPDENLARQLRACAALCETLGLGAWASEVYEADDIIGTWARRQRQAQPDAVIRIVSRDKDLAQLLRSDQDSLWDFQRNLHRHRAHIREQYGIEAEQLPCFLGLTGDSVDCIPGVPGIGPKAAAVLLQHFPDMPALYQNLEQVPGLALRGAASAARRLAEHQEQAELSRRLATIVDQPPLCNEPFCTAPLSALQRRAPDAAGLQALLQAEHVPPGEQQRLRDMLEQIG